MTSNAYIVIPRVVIVLVNYKNHQDTINCLKSLEKIEYCNFSVIVVDNDSKDGSYELLLRTYESSKQVRIVNSGYNGGFAYGNNIGIKLALNDDADYVLLLNNDTVVDKNFLKPLVAMAEREKNIGIVSSRIMFYPDKEKIWYAGGKVDWDNLRAIHFGLKETYSKKYNEIDSVGFATGCCMLVRKSVLEQVGLLSEDYFMYYEDMDYCLKVLEAGWDIKYVPNSVIFHCVSNSSGGDDSPFVIEWTNRARRIFFEKYKMKIHKRKRIFIFVKCEIRQLAKIMIDKNSAKKIQAYIKSFKKTE